MPLSIRSETVESRARELARRTGRTMTDAIGDALAQRLEAMEARAAGLREELLAIARDCAAAPDLDARSAEAILGYGPDGAP